jgi:hypothetical protein
MRAVLMYAEFGFSNAERSLAGFEKGFGNVPGSGDRIRPNGRGKMSPPTAGCPKGVRSSDSSNYFRSFAYSALASSRRGTSASAFFQAAKNWLYAVVAFAVSPLETYARAC